MICDSTQNTGLVFASCVPNPFNDKVVDVAGVGRCAYSDQEDFTSGSCGSGEVRVAGALYSDVTAVSSKNLTSDYREMLLNTATSIADSTGFIKSETTLN
jgi:hypothetical protein